MQPSDSEKVLACITAWREERSNGLNGMIAVLFVIQRRAVAGWEGGDWSKIVLAKNQFDSMTSVGDPNTVQFPDAHDPVYQKLLQWVDAIYGQMGTDGTAEDKLTNGALYYADMSSKAYQVGGWFDREIVQKPDAHPRVAQIGTTTYFA